MKTQGLVWGGLWVKDLPACIAFYRNVLELPLLARGQGFAHFDVGNGAMLELLDGGTASPEPKGPDQQPLVLGLRVTNLEKAVAELTSKGVVFLGEPDGYAGTRWAQFSDPEGNRLEIKELPLTP